MKLSILLVTISLLLGLSCAEDSVNSENNKQISVNATLIWQGDYAVDGCGFFFQIDSSKYKAVNEDIIPDEFKTTDTNNVRLNFYYLADKIEYYCGYRPNKSQIDGIKILSISKL